eukprot:CAMPEP_0178404378 /NCGR_PEP_ID=MMETSP0689_2-20121128/17851_1 /TAXON_ID=160604 /ORGANISM="Amphidinium massartii, Strain CS-259" /LENGTH=263 /DNA_ID=CAMNT_0020025357 /DNA_START=26 /DNA_END=817 /DNA_ORIENTATION=-
MAQGPRTYSQRRSRPGAAVLVVVAAVFAAVSATTLRAWVFGEATAPSAASRSVANGEQAPTSRRQGLMAAAAGALASFAVEESSIQPADADVAERRIVLPDIDRKDKKRCKWRSSSMGQANAARSSLFDLRECNLAGTSAMGNDIAGVIADNADFSNVDFEDAVMSKAVIRNAKLDGANFKNAVADRVVFTNSSMRGALFTNAVLTGTDFNGADLEGADFTDSYISRFDIKPLCANPTMKGTNPTTGASTFESAGCDFQGIGR